MSLVTRFAPSPTGYLHLGHALSAILAHDTARAADGRFLLRIEDIDHTRCRPAFADAVQADLAILGLSWDGPVWRQSARRHVYRHALDVLADKGLLYPCFCTRRQVAATSPGSGFDGPVYGGTCAALSRSEVAARLAAGQAPAWRLRLHHALALAGPLHWHDEVAGRQEWDGNGLGDVVLARRDISTSYHLAVTVDDAAQGVSHVIRGLDLFHQTSLHVLLQRLLDLPTPQYLHHRLLHGGAARKLSKSDRAPALRDMFQARRAPDSIVAHLRAMIAGATAWDSV